VSWRRRALVAGVITVGIFTVARMRAQTRTSEDYVQDAKLDDATRRMDQIDKHLDHNDGIDDEQTKEIQQAELNLVAMQAANHDDDTKWHEGIIAAIGACATALRFLGRKKTTA
jgi:hypothetical protein